MIMYPFVKETLASMSPDGENTWMDLLNVKISVAPLGFHLHSWSVARSLPYFLDKCDEGSFCLMNEFMDFAFEVQPSILQMFDTTQ